MARFKAISTDEATGKTIELFEASQTQFGMIPNMVRTMAHSPSLLEGFLCFSAALEKGVLDKQLKELIDVAVSEYNGCQYCVSDHTFVGEKLLGISSQTMIAVRKGEGINSKFDSALTFVRAILNQKGSVAGYQLSAVLDAGFTEEEVAEMIGHLSLTMLTNYFNNIVKTEVDFPRIALLKKIEN